MRRSTNPALRACTFAQAAEERDVAGGMTLGGTVLRAANLLVLTLASLVFASLESAWTPGFGLLAGIAALGTGCALRFRPERAAWGGAVFAVLLGLFLGGIAAPGLLQVVLAPVGVLATLLVLYQTRWIPPTRNRDLGVAAVAGGLVFLYLFQGAARSRWAWDPFPVPYVHESGAGVIGWTLLALAGSAYNLVLDFDVVEGGARQGAPKAMEWAAAFALVVAVAWFYVEAIVGLGRLLRNRA